MCPFCLATAAVAAASASGTGGVAALFTVKLLRRANRNTFTKHTDTKEDQHGNDDNGHETAEGGIAQRMD
jgi:hypothetical protein